MAFDDTTAAALVDRLRPDVYVKGGDYVPTMVPEIPHVEVYGGSVRILPYLEDRSTVELIERIRGSAGPAGGRPGAAGGRPGAAGEAPVEGRVEVEGRSERARGRRPGPDL